METYRTIFSLETVTEVINDNNYFYAVGFFEVTGI